MKTVRSIIGGVALGVITIVCSVPLNTTVSERFYDAIPIMRSMKEWQVIPGMVIATIAWGLLASFGFTILHEGIPGTGLGRRRVCNHHQM